MENKILDKIHSYAVSIRRQLHEYPETGFELSKTVALVSSELEKSGICYTYKF
jgi:metal-dependent amidase/aminoacylase/carboxypeptidase family protein